MASLYIHNRGGIPQAAYLPDDTRRDLIASMKKDRDLGFVRAMGLTPETFDKPHLLVQIDANLCGTYIGLHRNELEALYHSARLQWPVSEKQTPPFCVHKCVVWDRTFEEGKKKARRMLQYQWRKAGWRGGTREQFCEWLMKRRGDEEN
jgi:hypothetical protein